MRNLKFFKFKNIFFKNVKNAEKKKNKGWKKWIKKFKNLSMIKIKKYWASSTDWGGGAEIGLFPFNIFPPW